MSRLVRVTKVQNKLDFPHPHIPVGQVRIGYEVNPLAVGKQYIVLTDSKMFMTTVVQTIVDPTTFETENSIYKVETIKH